MPHAHRFGIATALPAIAAVLTLCGAAACGGARGSGELATAWTIEPPQPAVGMPTRVVIQLTGPEGMPVSGARLEIEAHMSHPGMEPVVAPAIERAPGVYEAGVEFTMAGPWTMVASGTLADGGRLMETFEVPEVR